MQPVVVRDMDAWKRLSEITTLRFDARSSNESGCNGSGDGTVTVSHPNPTTMTFTESGQWQTESGHQLKFNNVFRWSLDKASNTIRLEHLRFGSNNPVYLFDLAPNDEETWRSTSPHICRDDLYSATMKIADDHVGLRWTIKGPSKDEDISYRYS